MSLRQFCSLRCGSQLSNRRFRGSSDEGLFQVCWRPARAPDARVRHSSTSSASSPGAGPSRPSRKRYYLLAIPLALLPFTLFGTSRKPLDPYVYSDHKVGSTARLTPQHAQLSIPLEPTDTARWNATSADDEKVVTIRHVMVKNPDLQIERPYTPINNVAEDGEIRLIVKRVKGGEVGRMVHGLKPGGLIGLRGPLETLSLRPSQYDRIVMISTGTGVAPFLQLLNSLPASSISPELHLIHSRSRASEMDVLLAPGVLPKRPGLDVTIHRSEPGSIPTNLLQEVIRPRQEGKRVLVLVCLPQSLMRPLCGGLTMDMKQGPITGTLGQLGLTNAEVYKLE